MMKRFFILILILLWPAQAWPYIPSVNELLTDITARRVHLTELEAEYRLFDSLEEAQTAGAAGETDTPDSQQIVAYRAPDRIRINLIRPGGQETFMAVGQRVLSVGGARIEGSTWPQPFLLYRLLIDSEVVRLRELLSDLDFNLQKVSLGRYRDRIVFVLGARDEDAVQAQAWFDRETFRLVRLILPSGPNETPAYDLEMLNYRIHQKRVDWPDLIVARIKDRDPVFLGLSSLSLSTDEKSRDQTDPESPDPQTLDPEEILAKDPDILEMRQKMEKLRKKLE